VRYPSFFFSIQNPIEIFLTQAADPSGKFPMRQTRALPACPAAETLETAVSYPLSALSSRSGRTKVLAFD
jgi:hypothetical protein